MKSSPSSALPAVEVARIARLFPSYRDFVDDALFHPQWGYYSTGQVRFGEGGHYDTFPLALSPMFGRMVAHYAFRRWRRVGRPARFEVCEIGAGNGQLCLDVLVCATDRARRVRRAREQDWPRFADALRYRIIERSPALIVRQREHLGPVAESVRWTCADLSQRPARRTPFGDHGLVVANEVLDCLAHHKVVPRRDGRPGVAFVVPTLRGAAPSKPWLRLVAGVRPEQRAVPRDQLARVLADERLRRQVDFEEVVLPIDTLPKLASFARRHYPEFFAPGKFPPYFACPDIEQLVRNTARLYRHEEALWVDYGHTRVFHLTTSERRRVFAGPPRSGATIYRDPGRDDITFLVDFSVAGAAAERAGMEVAFYGGQAALACRSGVKLDEHARDLILRYRMLGWMLTVVGVGPERDWRHSGVTWNKRAGKGGRMRDDIRRGIDEFLGARPSIFKLMILRSQASREVAGRRR